jgi:glutaredoxin
MRKLAILAIALASASACAQTYRWVDPATGKTIISDSPPPATAKKVVKKEAELAVGAESYAIRRATENFPVLLYTSPDCTTLCKQARDLLNSRGVPFQEKMVQKQEEADELKALIGDTVVPTLKVGKQSTRGFQADTYNNLLDLAGYPTKAPPGSQPSGGLAK